MAFWKPSSDEDVRVLKHSADPLARFPSEPHVPPSVEHEASVQLDSLQHVDAIHGDWNELNGLAAHLSQTCERIEELAERTEGLLRRVEHLAAATSSQLEHTGLLPTPVHVAEVRSRVAASARPRLMPRGSGARWSRRLQRAEVRVRTELVTLWLVARVKVIRHVSIPASHAAAILRKRLVVARMRAAVHAERWLDQARASFTPRAMPVKVTLAIHPIRVPHVHAPGVINVSGAVALSAAIAVLLMAIGAPAPVLHLPPVLQPTLATTLPGPVWLDALFSGPPAPAPIDPVSTTAALPRPVPAGNAATGAFVGTLVIESDPVGATVFVNRERVGETPLTLPDLRAGSRVIWLESDGYQRWSAGVLVPAEKNTRLNVKMTRDPGK
ncbi:MAG TPA: PEGA domain-containing protein [Vicinamibacterales bacterium]|nr:PEGA domain-containing protein [Vicinamibacterales bacterium]